MSARTRGLVMYVRFIVLTPRRRRAAGLFRADTWAVEDPELAPWLREQIGEQYAWFNKNLRVPHNRAQRGRRIHVTAICWFREHAHRHIAHSRYLAWLIAEAGHPTA